MQQALAVSRRELITVTDLETIILGTVPPFQRYATAIETEPVGKNLCGQYVRRTLSYVLVPIMTVAILGADNASNYFPRLLAMFDNLVNAIRAELRSGIAIYRYDVAVHPFNRATLYFSSRLQEAVLNGLYMHNMPLYGQLQRWIQERFNHEARTFYGGGTPYPGILDPTAPRPVEPLAPQSSNIPVPRVLPTVPNLNVGGIRPSEVDPYAQWTLPPSDRLIQQIQPDKTAHPAPRLVQPSMNYRTAEANAKKILKQGANAAPLIQPPTRNLHRAVTAPCDKP